MNMNGCRHNLFIIVFEVWKLVKQVITDIKFYRPLHTDSLEMWHKSILCSRQRDANYFGHIFLSNVKDFANADLT